MSWTSAVPPGWPVVLRSARLRLEPVSVAHAEPMAVVLADPLLYIVIGGEPPDLPALRRRYLRWEIPLSDDGGEGWLNWIVLHDGHPVGTVQATVSREPEPVAELAWIVGVAFQRKGFAAEAAGLVATWLTGQGVRELCAHVEPGHLPSERVAARLGLAPTGEVHDGERRWASVQ